MEILRRIVYLVFRPDAEWARIASEPTTVDSLLRHCILPLSALAPIATFIGMEVFDRSWDVDQGYLVPPELIFNTAAATFFATIASIFTLAAIMTLIAPMYQCKRDYVAALKVAAYGAIPLLLSGAVLFLPAMIVVSMVAVCHTLFLYNVGATRVLQIREDQAEFIGISLLLLTFVLMMAGMAAAGAGII
ncbi:MAG: YIP1 family protein [Pseudomonadota bacterium]|nr:YIP1 family protein [Pseudomonadota bacterium]